MKRILFVDDDPLLARAYASVLQEDRARWETRTTTNARQALEMLDATPFDVLVTDLRMPGMSGTELLEEVRKRHPAISRIIISGVRDQAQVARSLGVTHQFIPKPVDLATLRGTLTRVCGLDSLLMDDKLQALAAQFDALPSFPEIYMEVTTELSSAEPSIERVAQLAGRDPAMTAKMLQIVNSAAFGLKNRILTPFDAVQYLGTGTVRALVLTVHVFSCFERQAEGFSIEKFISHAWRTATLARAIAMDQGAEAAITEDSGIAGMLHDIGELMLASHLPEKYQEAITLAAAEQRPLWAAETSVFGAPHSAVGAYLLGLWGLPTPIVEAVAFHHNPGLSDLRVFEPLAAVHVADVLEDEQKGPQQPIPRPTLDAEYLLAINVLDRLEDWRILAQAVTSPAVK